MLFTLLRKLYIFNCWFCSFNSFTVSRNFLLMLAIYLLTFSNFLSIPDFSFPLHNFFIDIIIFFTNHSHFHLFFISTLFKVSLQLVASHVFSSWLWRQLLKSCYSCFFRLSHDFIFSVFLFLFSFFFMLFSYFSSCRLLRFWFSSSLFIMLASIFSSHLFSFHAFSDIHVLLLLFNV